MTWWMAKPPCIVGEEDDLGIWGVLRKDGIAWGMRRNKESLKNWKKEGKKITGKMLKKRSTREEEESSRGILVE